MCVKSLRLEFEEQFKQPKDPSFDSGFVQTFETKHRVVLTFLNKNQPLLRNVVITQSGLCIICDTLPTRPWEN